MRTKILSVMIGLMSLGMFSPAWGARFASPKWNGYALDWCANFEQNCGQPAAELFCKKKGYDRSSSFQINPNVNFQTMTIGQNAICNPSVHRCDSFNYIDCVKNTRTFNNPSYNGYRLDWCRVFERECGAPAADAFCRKNGFARSTNFQIQSQVNVQTMTVGSNAICNPNFHGCDSFTFVTCSN